MLIAGLDGAPDLSLPAPIQLALKATRAVVLGTEPDGNPVFTCSDYGKGKFISSACY